MVTVLLLEILHRLLQHSTQSILLVVCRDDQGHEHFGIGDLEGLFNRNLLLAQHFFLRYVEVMPTRHRLRSGYRTIALDCYVVFLRFSSRSRCWSEEVEE